MQGIERHLSLRQKVGEARQARRARQATGDFNLTRRLLALSVMQVFSLTRPARSRAASPSQRRCPCQDCEEKRLTCEQSISEVSSRNLRFVFFTEPTLSCDALRASANLISKAKGRFRARALVEELFAARTGSRPTAGCRWEKGEWFAAVLEETTGRPVSFYHGAPKGSGESEVVQYLEATLQDPIQGATSWGFSLLLHRLKLKGATTCRLVDESDTMKTPVLIDGHEYTTRGSLIYGRTMDPKRPYTYSVRESKLRKLSFWSRTEYTYDLSSEARGKLYPSDPL